MKALSLRCLILLASLIAMAAPVLSQTPTLFNGKAVITVAPNTSLSVRGDIENQGMILNNGHLKVSGQWVNAGTYEAGEGEVTFNSSSSTVPQIIHHNGQTFNRVTIAGGTKKIISSDIVIAKQITFRQGIIESSGNARILFDPGVQIIGASDASHVHGAVYHKGSGSKVFPIGNGLVYLPVKLPDVSDPSSLIGVRAFEFNNVTLNIHASLEAIDSRRYWHIDMASGIIAPSAIVLPLRDALWIKDPANVVVAQSGGPSEDFTSIGGSLLEGDTNYGAIKSQFKVTMPFVALATSAPEAPLIVYNAVSPNGDGLNDYLRIENIEMHPENKLILMNRWGDTIFEIENYDNKVRVFEGKSNRGEKELASGTYFYSLETSTGIKMNGFLVLKK